MKFRKKNVAMKFNKRTIRRLILAAVVSGSGIAATRFWYSSVSTNSSSLEATKSIAQILESRNEVQRKRANRAIWHGIGNSTELGAGDSIRTGPNSGAKIEFIASKTMIDIDPDSLVKIEENNGKFALDLVKGNLFVKNEGTPEQSGGGLTVRSGDKEIDLTNAEAAFGKDEKGGLAVQVFKGRVEGASANGLEVLSPSPIEPVYIDTQQVKAVDFAWKMKNGEKYRMHLDIGKTPLTMEEMDSVAGTLANVGMFSSQVKIGVHYWRLRAEPLDPTLQQIVTRPIKIDVRPKSPPLAIEPSPNSKIRVKEGQLSVRFRWANVARLPKVRFELARSPSSDKVVTVQEFESETAVEVELKEPGEYYWRVSGITKTEVDAPGKFVKFTVDDKADLPAPTLQAPLANQRLPFQFLKESGLYLRWEPVEGAIGYKLTLNRGGTSQVFESEANLQRIAEFADGDYEWKVEAKSEDGTFSKPSESRRFRIQQIRKVEWAQVKETDVLWYVTPSPTYALEWSTAGHEDVTNWRIKVASENESLNDSESLIVTSPRKEFSAQKDGAFVSEVEGLNNDGFVVAKSTRRKFVVKQLPLPDAPTFSKDVSTYKANGSGDVELAWAPVSAAKTYFIKVTDAVGAQVKLIEVPANRGRLNRLMPGNYKVSVVASDAYGRRGPASEPRAIEVPNTSDLKAPKLKKIKIK